MKTILALIAIALMFSGQAFADDSAVTQDDIAGLFKTNQDDASTFRYCYYEFQPEEDITAYELAICMKFMHRDYGGTGQPPEKVQRHFREVCQ